MPAAKQGPAAKLCPCGSGKTYRKCCRRRDLERKDPAATPPADATKKTDAAQTVGVAGRLPGPWYRHLLAIVGLLAFACALYRGDLQLGFFNLDDPDYVLHNPWIRAVSSANIVHILTTPYFANYSPLHLFSYMLDYAVDGLNPYVFHLASNLWAGLGAAMLYLLVLALSGRFAVALCSGLLFIAHPAHVEAVAWISSRKDLIAVAFALPAMLAWLRYLAGGPRRYGWAALSLLLFVLAVAGKQSVVVVPAIAFIYEYFATGRRGWGMWLDKLPFVAVVAGFGVMTMGAQASTRHLPDPYVLLCSFRDNLWLLSGLGEYTPYRLRPDTEQLWLRLLCAAILVAMIVVPFLLRRRLPAWALVGYYSLCVALAPPQILSFVHPVTDRYLYFPSFVAAIFVGWGAFAWLGGRGKGPQILPVAVIALVLCTWSWKTLAYLDDWQDPRSVWYAASSKSKDPNVSLYLGTVYHDAADRLPQILGDADADLAPPRALARAVWADDPRLEELLSSWAGENPNGPVTREYQEALRDLAWEQFERTTKLNIDRVLPNLYFRRGKLLMDRRKLDEAMIEFARSAEEAGKHTAPSIRQSVTVMAHNAMGAVAWRQRDYDRAMVLMRQAEAEQREYGGNWVPDVRQNIERLKGLIARRDAAANRAAAKEQP